MTEQFYLLKENNFELYLISNYVFICSFNFYILILIMFDIYRYIDTYFTVIQVNYRNVYKVFYISITIYYIFLVQFFLLLIISFYIFFVCNIKTIEILVLMVRYILLCNFKMYFKINVITR